MLFLVTARSIVYHDGTWGEALSTISISNVFEEHATCTADNEYYNHCLLVEADQLTGRYQYGTASLAVMLNWIPRQIWADKPARNKGFFPAAMDAFQSGKGNNLGHGGAWGPVADSFDNYWFLFPLFWLGVGYGIAAIYVRAFQENSLRWKLRYVGVLCATHWFISQSLAEAFVPAMIYQGAYFLAFWCPPRDTFPTAANRPRPRSPSRPTRIFPSLPGGGPGGKNALCRARHPPTGRDAFSPVH